MRSIKLAAFGAALLLAAGCSSSHPAPAAASGSPVAGQSSPAASPSPSASPSGLGVALGTARTESAQGEAIKVTALSYKVITLTADNQELAASGTKVALVQAEGCLTGGGDVTFTWSPWTLVTSSGATVTPFSAYGTRDFPGSLYPNDSTVATPAGRCRSGLIPFSLAGVSGTPVAVEYNTDGIVLDWRVA